MNNVGIIVTARVKSSRIHEKVLHPITDKRAIEILLEKCRNDKYPVYLAIPEAKEDDILLEIGEKMGVDVYRGEDRSPLHRLSGCAKANNLDVVVRVTADDILIDRNLLMNQIAWHVKGGNDYTYMRLCPEGVAAEVINANVLHEVADEYSGESIEFVSYYLKRNGYQVKEFYPPREFQYSFRLTMDYPEDVLLLQVLFRMLPEPFSTLDVIHLLRKNKFLMRINRLPLVTVYTCNYNQSKYISKCIDSVLGAGFSDYEYIIIDDHSTDGSANIILEKLSLLDTETMKKVRVYFKRKMFPGQIRKKS